MQSVTTKIRTGRSVWQAATKLALITGIVAVSAAFTGQQMMEEATVEVVLQDNQIQAPDSVEAGAVDFQVKNMGQEPLGFIVQNAQGQAAVEIETVEPEATETGQARLTPGTYRLLATDSQGQPVNARNLSVYQAAENR
jgi:hypothetical protein